MKYFSCAVCSNQIFFANSHCVNCQTALGYIASEKQMGCFEKHSPTLWLALNPEIKGKRFKPCHNYQHHQICNWMVLLTVRKFIVNLACSRTPFPT
jgi:Uncharacterized protein conserved in bacteria